MKVFNSSKHNLNQEFEILNNKLNDDNFLLEYKSKYDDYKVDILPKILGWFIVVCGNIVYGKEPSFLKFRAVEVIARVPYQSWSSAAYTLLTLFYTREDKALSLAESKLFSRHANDNETMHVITLSQIVKEEHKKVDPIRHTIIPMLFAFFYFWASYVLYLINKKWSYELNYLFESHAFSQYSIFIHRYADRLKEKEIHSDFLKWYGREPKNQYEFLLGIRNDEIIHRNVSIQEIERYCSEKSCK